MKKFYSKPTLEVDVFACEQGFQASGDFSVKSLNDVEEEY